MKNPLIKLIEGLDMRLLYHGTSEMQLDRIRRNGYDVSSLYLADDKYKSEDYSEMQANADSSGWVVVTLDRSKMHGPLEKDSGSGPEEWEQEMGQWTYSGNIEDAIIKIETMSDEDGEGKWYKTDSGVPFRY